MFLLRTVMMFNSRGLGFRRYPAMSAAIITCLIPAFQAELFHFRAHYVLMLISRFRFDAAWHAHKKSREDKVTMAPLCMFCVPSAFSHKGKITTSKHYRRLPCPFSLGPICESEKQACEGPN